MAQASSLVQAIGAALVLTATVLAGCDRAPADSREWRPADHESLDQAPATAPTQRPPSKETDQTLVEVAWQRSCASCHGPTGRGDGPEGPMVRAPDLTRADWQARVTDAQLAETIRGGRNRMPAFGDLPASVIDGLVRRIRASRGR